MVEPGKEITSNLIQLIQTTGYPIVQQNGQRKFGPPPNWIGAPPKKGCEVFVGKLPREIYEDELVPIFSTAGKIYEMRLMMDFSGSNRGYAFVTYATRAEAHAAVRQLNGFEVRPGRRMGVVKSVDNCRLFVGGIPKNKSKEDILFELSKHVAGIVEVILYKNCYDKRLNRGFAFVEFTSHRAAAMARRALVPGCVRIWDQDVMVDWAEPEPDVDDDQMLKVRVVYARNFQIKTTPETIQHFFETAIACRVERVKKIYDYAFIHFYEREHAELAILKLQNAELDGSIIELKWAKPVDRELYRIQKMTKGNAKFNKGLDLSQTLLLYKQQSKKRDYEHSQREDEGIGSACAGESSCESPSNGNITTLSQSSKELYALAPAKLESLCKRYSWLPPCYQYQKYWSASGEAMWICNVKLPLVGLPLVTPPSHVGPFATRPCFSMQQSYVEAAEIALHHIKLLQNEIMQRPASTPIPPLYPPLVTAVPNCLGLPYDYMNIPCPQPVGSMVPIDISSLRDPFDRLTLF